jgi:choline dehydrogenase-like flavoprotein
MIIPATDIDRDSVLRADVVVVGSGAAGIPLALELGAAGRQVILLEAGHQKLRNRDQEQYEGTVVDPALHQPAAKYRQRCLGGSTTTWGGRCVPFDPIDFEQRDFVPLSGWPITYEELCEYYPAANEWLEAGEFRYDSRDVFASSTPPLIGNFDSGLVSLDSLERFSRPTNLFQRYEARFEASQNVRLIFGANCTNIAVCDQGDKVSRLHVSTLDGKKFYVEASVYVLAAGGIETTRLLLASNDVLEDGIGNDNDLVGRYYMCHIAGNVGTLRFTVPKDKVRHGYEISREGIYCRRRICLAPEEQLRHRANNVVFRLHFPRISDPAHKSGVLSLIYLGRWFISYEYATRLRDSDEDTVKSTLLHVKNVLFSPIETARFLLRWIAKRNLASRKFPSIILENKSNLFSLEVHGEQVPNFDSRIYLSEEKDRLGMPKVVIDWQYTAQDIDSVRHSLSVLRDELARTGTGELSFDETTLEEDLLRFGAYGGHHGGTTRMGTDAKTSVVDTNCQVHGVGNLYIASNSVFPTSSQANPTLTITALALRLAAHLNRNLSHGDTTTDARS